MKAVRYAKDIFKRLNDLGISNSNPNSNSNSLKNNRPEDFDTDEYYIRIGERPPRFQLYQQARWEKLDEGEGQCVDDFITLDELNFILKQQLAMTPEARYQHRRNKGIWHDCGIESAGVDCNPSCKFYPPVGRIEDQEIIEEHNRDVERMKQEGRIVEPPSEEEMLRILSSEDL